MAQSSAARRLRPLLLVLAQVFASALLAGPCVPSATTLCLNDNRFRVEVNWKDSHQRTGVGQAVPITSDTGDFWFFSAANVELVVKVLDARGVNGNFWVFYGALSNVEYDLVVTDTATDRVKTYSNPQGQFASVGDTKAFAASLSPTELSTRMDVEGFTPDGEALEDLQASTLLPVHEADAAPALCDGAATELGLNGCRFRLSVSWKDSSGRTGVGQPVPLTDDTGYFWFFSPENIELVIKVLDARAINGNFWVFYGALSNVEYTLTVTDTLTGATHTYTNPSGQFASVGDTKAFHPGYSVAAQLDTARAASALVPVGGGTVSTNSADGTVFTLTVPEGALLSDETITLTPVAAADRIPFSGGVGAAVRLGPEGLLLFQPATLVISPPAPIPADAEVTFAWRGSGDEFGLFPPDPTATPAVSLSVSHLATYGVGRATGAELDAQRSRPLEGAFDQLEQALQEPASEQRRALRGTGPQGILEAEGTRHPSGQTPAQQQATEELQEWFDSNLKLTIVDCGPEMQSDIARLGGFLKRVLLLTGPDAGLLSDVKSKYETLYSAFQTCYDDAYAACKTEMDPSQAASMARFYAILKAEGVENRLDKNKIPLCLTFEITFDSYIEEIMVPGSGQTWAFRHRLKAVVPGVSYSPDGGGPSLSAPLEYVIHDYTGTISDPKCTMTTDGQNSVFTFEKMSFDLNVFEGGNQSPYWLSVVFDPGHPNFTFTLSCEGAPPLEITQPRWRSAFEGVLPVPFGQEDITVSGFQRVSSGAIFARWTHTSDASYGVVQSEVSTMELKHTPQ
ncbi:MAG TPA: hypothetical protein VGK26_00885 [Thermoanaerobaculia bacterium]|jgi:hypothetical protein